MTMLTSHEMMLTEPPTNGDQRREKRPVAYSAAQDALANTVSDGGGTFYADTLLPAGLRQGFAVGIGGAILDPRFVDADSLATTAKRVGQEFISTYVGTWLDENILYVDAVEVLAPDRLHDALALARDKGQKAIFDFSTGREITL
jgi:hypothetical protein